MKVLENFLLILTNFMSSSHPDHTKRSIICSQCLTFSSVYFLERDFARHTEEMKNGQLIEKSRSWQAKSDRISRSSSCDYVPRNS